jgi:hypothetical protein
MSALSLSQQNDGQPKGEGRAEVRIMLSTYRTPLITVAIAIGLIAASAHALGCQTGDEETSRGESVLPTEVAGAQGSAVESGPSASSASAYGGGPDKQIVFGRDDRVEVGSVGNGSSVVALLPGDALTQQGDSFNFTARVDTHDLVDGVPLCPGERFVGQTRAALCSGVLVAPNLVATAAHCVDVKSSGCEPGLTPDLWFAFGYTQRGPESRKRLSVRDVYRGDVVACRQGHDENNGPDWALVRLVPEDRHRGVERVAASLAVSPVKAGASIYALGFPLGLPMKFVDGAMVLGGAEHRFTATLDVFTYNSGSPVFNAKDELIGLAVNKPFASFRKQAAPATGRACMTTIQCSAGVPTCAIGASVQRISALRDPIIHHSQQQQDGEEM